MRSDGEPGSGVVNSDVTENEQFLWVRDVAFVADMMGSRHRGVAKSGPRGNLVLLMATGSDIVADVEGREANYRKSDGGFVQLTEWLCVGDCRWKSLRQRSSSLGDLSVIGGQGGPRGNAQSYCH